MRKLLAGLFAVLIMVTASAPAEARREWPGVGAGGGVLSIVQCPQGKAMVGLTGAHGDFIDRLQIVCATLYADGTYGPPEPYGDPVGGAGGGQMPMKVCPRNSKLFDMAIVVDVSNLRYLQTVNFHCRDLSGNISTQMMNNYSERYFSGNGQQQYGLQSCPQEHFVGLKIYFRDYVKAVGVVCDNVNMTPVAVVPPPRPVKSSAPVRPGPILASRAAFGGKWRTRTNSNADFDIILVPQGDGIIPTAGRIIEMPLSVAGHFVNLQDAHDYDGTLQGTIPPNSRTLIYSYTQKNGAAGTGTFTLSPDGNSLTGEGTASDGQKFTWNGRRAP